MSPLTPAVEVDVSTPGAREVARLRLESMESFYDKNTFISGSSVRWLFAAANALLGELEER